MVGWPIGYCSVATPFGLREGIPPSTSPLCAIDTAAQAAWACMFLGEAARNGFSTCRWGAAQENGPTSDVGRPSHSCSRSLLGVVNADESSFAISFCLIYCILTVILPRVARSLCSGLHRDSRGPSSLGPSCSHLTATLSLTVLLLNCRISAVLGTRRHHGIPSKRRAHEVRSSEMALGRLIATILAMFPSRKSRRIQLLTLGAHVHQDRPGACYQHPQGDQQRGDFAETQACARLHRLYMGP